MSKTGMFLLVCGLFLSVPSFVVAKNHLHSKADFIKQKVPKGHDFTKIEKNAKYRPNHLLIRFASRADGKEIKLSKKLDILDSIGGATIKRSYKKTSGLTLVKLPPGQSVADALRIYNAKENILYAEPDYEVKIFASDPNDTYFDDLWGMHNTGQTHPVYGGGTSSGTSGADIDAPEAWDIITDANDIIIAVIDSGVDYSHSDLAGNMWRTIEEPNDANNDGYPGIQGVDDDGDGLIDEDSGSWGRR